MEVLLRSAIVSGFTVVVTLLVAWIKVKTTKWNKKINGPVIDEIHAQLIEWIDISIIATKGFVDKLKQNNEWDKSSGVYDRQTYNRNSNEAMDRCVVVLKSLMPKAFKNLVKHFYDDPDMLYKVLIEARLKAKNSYKKSLNKKARRE